MPLMHGVDDIIVIGSGNWGMALAGLFAVRHRVRVWTIDRAMADDLNAERRNPAREHRRPLPDSLVIEPKYASPFDEAKSLLILAVPSSQVYNVASELAAHVSKPLIVSVSKGFDVERQCTMSEVIKRAIPGASVVVLTGPTIANEVADGKPTRAVLASDDLTALSLVKQALKNDVVSFEVSRFPTHHEICAALKGIVAIAVGLAEGLNLGNNAQGVIMTAGLRELAVVGSFFGVPENVAYGVSGAGDLITTCISPDSRNRRLGVLLAKGRTLEQALEEVRMTVEGVAMARTIETLWSLDVSIPLFHSVNAILSGQSCDIRKELTDLIATF
jgi:glycerol-3-phosphate dehydrogenase (NAD(P)+)